MEISEASGISCSYQRSEASGGTHFTFKTICRQLWGSSSARVQTGKLCGEDHVGLEWMDEKGQRGAWGSGGVSGRASQYYRIKKKKTLVGSTWWGC